ncbi:hypothetical protein MKX03_016197 [Papaver bracteatum]|nr:hypothetical protein MKX03_016197 [Papaver bracteatum]
MDSSNSHPRPSSRLSDVPRVRELTESDTEKNRIIMNDVVLLIAQYLVQQIANQMTMKPVLQQRELQLEMLHIATRDRRSSMSENKKQEILEKRRKAYTMRIIRVGVATNNEHRAEPIENSYLHLRMYC